MGAPGCDDAPVVAATLAQSVQRDLTIIYPYYDNPIFFAKQLAHWKSLPTPFRSRVKFIVVDDGSPNYPADVVITKVGKEDLNLKLFRIGVDVRWNWLAARNIAAHHADTRWLLITDMDHIIPVETLRTVLYGVLGTEKIYRFSRIGVKTHPHPNSWLYTRDMYWRVGGYDEALSGHYGTDGEYRRRCAATAPIRILTAPLELHEHEDDASTTGYKRKQPEDAGAKKLMRQRGKNWKPRTLSFPYQEVGI